MTTLTREDVLFLDSLLLRLTDAKVTPFCIFSIADFASVADLKDKTLTTLSELEKHAADPSHEFDPQNTLTVNDFLNFKNIIESSAHRNVFEISEYKAIHGVHGKIVQIIELTIERQKRAKKSEESEGVQETKDN